MWACSQRLWTKTAVATFECCRCLTGSCLCVRCCRVEAAMAVIHISEATRKRVLQRGGVMPPPVEPDLAVWRQAEAKRRQQQEEQERRRVASIPRSSSLELERGHRLHKNRPWVERPPPPRPISRVEQARRGRQERMAAVVNAADGAPAGGQQELAATVLGRLRDGAFSVPGPELDLRGLELTGLDEDAVALVAARRGARPWDPEQLKSLFPVKRPQSRQRRSRRSQRSGSPPRPVSASIDVIGGVDISGVRRAWGTPFRAWPCRELHPCAGRIGALTYSARVAFVGGLQNARHVRTRMRPVSAHANFVAWCWSHAQATRVVLLPFQSLMSCGSVRTG